MPTNTMSISFIVIEVTLNPVFFVFVCTETTGPNALVAMRVCSCACEIGTICE